MLGGGYLQLLALRGLRHPEPEGIILGLVENSRCPVPPLPLHLAYELGCPELVYVVVDLLLVHAQLLGYVHGARGLRKLLDYPPAQAAREVLERLGAVKERYRYGRLLLSRAQQEVLLHTITNIVIL